MRPTSVSSHQRRKGALMETSKKYADVFVANPKTVTACRGPPIKLEVKDLNSTPYVAPMRHYTPEQRKVTQAEIEKLHKTGPIVPSTSQYASCCRTVRKKDGTVRVVSDFRGLKALLKAQSGGLGHLLTIYDKMDQSAYFSCLDLASGFLQLTIHEPDRHLTAFRDAEGILWEYVRCGFDLKTVPSAFTNYVGGIIMEMKKGVRNWLNDIIIPTRTFEEQLELLRETFDCLRQNKLSVDLPRPEFCFLVVEWLGMNIDRFGIRPAPINSKIEAITQRYFGWLTNSPSYLQVKQFALITDCSALTWLFKSQALPAKYHRWALRLMQYDMELQ